MKLTSEKSLSEFKFWSGAADRVSCLTDEELNTIESELEDLYSEGIDETALNDLFWFDFDWVCGIIGSDEETILERNEG